MNYIIIIKLALCTYAAIWVPFHVTAEIFGLERIRDFLSYFEGLPGLIGFAGLIWIGIDLWQSKRTNDDKIWWTIVGFLFFPIAVPAYWFMFGWPETMERLNEQRARGSVKATNEAREIK